MRVVIIHQYFKTPTEGGAIRSYYLAKGLLDHGHEVAVITAHNHATKFEELEGIDIHYLSVYYDNKLGAISRVMAFLKFVVFATIKAFQLPKGDINYVISTPLSVGFIAIVLKIFRRTPFVFEIGDLWPKAPIELGYIKNTQLKQLLYWFEKLVYSKSRSIVAMSPDIVDYVLQTQPATKIMMIPNMSDCEYYQPVVKPLDIEQKYDVEDKFIIAYIGTAGRANHLEYLVDAAIACAHKLPQVHFLVAAAGRELASIRELVHTHQLTNMTFTKYLDRDGVKELLAVTDAIYVSFANVPILASGSPNKFFDGLAAGKLVITNFGGWIKNVLEENQCGFSYDPENIDEMVAELTSYTKDEKKCNFAKQQARRLAEKSFARELLLGQWMQLFG
jgi:glycosyltransferase involved in cell wall biosynthesis